MTLYHLKSIAVSLAVAAGLGAVLGIVYALIAGQVLLYGIGTGWLIAGLFVLAGGLLGAAEPPEGWITGRATGRGQFGRRSVIARIATEHPDIEDVSSAELAIWGVVVGGLLLTAATILFEVAH